MIEKANHITCVGEALNGIEAIQFLEKHTVDLVLLDINMPEMNGIDACKVIDKRFPDTKVVALSMFSEFSYIEKMIKSGASGYLLKNATNMELLEAIDEVMSGKTYYSQDVVNAMVNSFKGIRMGKEGKQKVFPKLSRREKQILGMIMDEKTSQQIADELYISFWTVESHRRNLMKKLEVKNTVGLVKTTLENHLLD